MIELEYILNTYLENKSLEEFLEEFNITPLEAVESLFEDGLLDPDILERMIPADAGY